MIEGSLKHRKPGLEIHVAKTVDPAVQFDRKKIIYWNQTPLNPDVHCVARQYERNVPNVELNYMITVLQPFMD